MTDRGFVQMNKIKAKRKNGYGAVPHGGLPGKEYVPVLHGKRG